jgi:hypothetical protein
MQVKDLPVNLPDLPEGLMKSSAPSMKGITPLFFSRL